MNEYTDKLLNYDTCQYGSLKHNQDEVKVLEKEKVLMQCELKQTKDKCQKLDDELQSLKLTHE